VIRRAGERARCMAAAGPATFALHASGSRHRTGSGKIQRSVESVRHSDYADEFKDILQTLGRVEDRVSSIASEEITPDEDDSG
jgi:hypothetical protein